MNIVILDGYTTNPGDLSWEWLSEFGNYTVYDDCQNEKEIIERAIDCEIIITNKTPLNEETLSKLPKLKFVALLSTGYNIIDIHYAKKMDILVANVPTYSTGAVAQQTFALILEFTNQVANHSSSVKKGDWQKVKRFSYWNTPLTELNGKTIGIIGFGSIGKEVAKIADAFSMKILAFTPRIPKDSYKNVTFVSKEELLAKSDFVTIHTPLNENTYRMVNDEFFSLMKNTAYFVNTSRGAVVDEDALYHALKDEKIAGAGIDVMDTEPPQDDKLFSCDSLFITPHISWAAFETRKRLLGVVKENIRAFINGNPQNIVNK